jgi:hypothetical protein
MPGPIFWLVFSLCGAVLLVFVFRIAFGPEPKTADAQTSEIASYRRDITAELRELNRAARDLTIDLEKFGADPTTLPLECITDLARRGLAVGKRIASSRPENQARLNRIVRIAIEMTAKNAAWHLLTQRDRVGNLATGVIEALILYRHGLVHDDPLASEEGQLAAGLNYVDLDQRDKDRLTKTRANA